jgi:exonuclease SbcD
MKIAHLSDTHLGYRAYGRTTPGGINQREFDVMKTFKSCLDAIAARDPDVVVHSGDLFHVVRPSNATIHRTFKLISQFQAIRGGKPFIIIGGNHDTPRMAESGNILPLLSEIPGMHIQVGRATAFEIADYDLEVLAVPSDSILSKEPIDWVPQLKKKYSILTLHGIAREALEQASKFTIDDTRPDRWSYIAMGDFHEHKSFGKNVCYAGSTDYASTNIWQEARTPKGWVLFDTETRKQEFIKLQPRRVIDLPVIDAGDMAAEALAASLRENAQWKPEEMPIVRQKVNNVHPDTRGQLGSSLLRELSATCLTYVLRLMPPELAGSSPEFARTEAFTLEKAWEEHVREIELPGGIERGQINTMGLELLKEVEERASDPAKA